MTEKDFSTINWARTYRKLLSAHGVTNKQISNKRNKLKYGKAQL